MGLSALEVPQSTFAYVAGIQPAKLARAMNGVQTSVETVQEYYAQFVPAARNAVQTKMDSGIGIEEQARISQQRQRKVVGIR